MPLERLRFWANENTNKNLLKIGEEKENLFLEWLVKDIRYEKTKPHRS